MLRIKQKTGLSAASIDASKQIKTQQKATKHNISKMKSNGCPYLK